MRRRPPPTPRRAQRHRHPWDRIAPRARPMVPPAPPPARAARATEPDRS